MGVPFKRRKPEAINGPRLLTIIELVIPSVLMSRDNTSNVRDAFDALAFEFFDVAGQGRNQYAKQREDAAKKADKDRIRRWAA